MRLRRPLILVAKIRSYFFVYYYYHTGFSTEGVDKLEADVEGGTVAVDGGGGGGIKTVSSSLAGVVSMASTSSS